MRKNLTKILTSIGLLSLVAFAVYAQGVLDIFQGPINRIKTSLETLGVIVAVVFVILGGYKFMTAGGSAENIETGKKYIMWALVGLAIVLLAEGLTRLACFIATGSTSCPESQ